MFTPEWEAFKRGKRLRIPGFYNSDDTPQPVHYWRGLLDYVTPMFPHCRVIPSEEKTTLRWGKAEFMHGPLPPHPNDAELVAMGEERLYTPCYILQGHKQLFASWEDCPFKMSGRTRGYKNDRRNASKGYIYVKPGGMDDNSTDFGLHRLLCHMYHGPPSEAGLVVHHRCNHTLCLCPWHMKWCTQSENVRRAWAHKKRQDWAPSKPK
jgi:hypothetical protein